MTENGFFEEKKMCSRWCRELKGLEGWQRSLHCQIESWKEELEKIRKKFQKEKRTCLCLQASMNNNDGDHN